MPPEGVPRCTRAFDGIECAARGAHRCQPRAWHVGAFFSEILVHTKGRWAREQFHLMDWQLDDIMKPIFADVVWSTEFDRYVRKHRIAYIEIARKNGKALAVDTPILAGRGWTTMGELVPGDQVHALDGTLVDVQWVSARHVRESYRVRFRDGAKIIAADDHKWLVRDRRAMSDRVVTTTEIADTLHHEQGGQRGDLRYAVAVPGPIQRPWGVMPIIRPSPKRAGSRNAIVGVDPVGPREVVCIAVDHPDHVFLAGRLMTPTHNSELLAGIALYLLVSDDEEGAEIYGCAVDRDQARKVFDVAERMVQLSPLLSARLKIQKAAKRLVDPVTGSYYEVTAADAGGNLGHNPHGVVFDELAIQKSGDLWNAMRTGMGAREQPLMVAATTAGDDLTGFGKTQHDEMERVAENPDRAAHIFVYMRNLPMDADPWDESNWHIPNPALGKFLSLQSLRDEATEAKNDPSKENPFRIYRLNQWVSQASRWLPMHLWDACTGDLWLRPDSHRNRLIGRTAYAGFDLASKFDLVAWAVCLPGDTEDDPVDFLWRFWLPEDALHKLDQAHEGKFSRWARLGWLTVTEGSVIDYDKVIADIAEDAKDFKILGADCDEWSMWPVINRVADVLGLDPDRGELTAYRNTYDRISPGMNELMGLFKTERLRHFGNPLARLCFDLVEVRHAPYDPLLIRPNKPERGRDKARIDAVPAAAMAANAWRSRQDGLLTSAYEKNNLMII